MTVVILASSSPRRTELLSAAGVAHEIVTPPPDIDPPAGMSAEAAVVLIAECKAAAVAATSPPGAFVIGADTMVVGRGPLGKPGGPERARLMLRELRGREHTVLTGISVRGAGRCCSGVSRSRVVMRAVSDADIEAYIATGEPFDKAGGYAIQGCGEALVESVSGRIDTVIGLDVRLTRELLIRAGCPIALEPAADRPLRPTATGTSA